MKLSIATRYVDIGLGGQNDTVHQQGFCWSPRLGGDAVVRLGEVRTSSGISVAVAENGLVYKAPIAGRLMDVIGSGQNGLISLREGAERVDINDKLMPPIAPSKVVAVGLNYRDHIREAGAAIPVTPLVFGKFPSTIIGPQDEIVIDPTLTARADWEGELAVVIGERLFRERPDVAMERVFGYCVANDVSARDLSFPEGHWVRGKNFDTFCPLGPFIVTRDEVPNPQRLRLRTHVNGEIMQESSTSEMLFPIRDLLSFISYHCTLLPGDVVLTGTPAGCGEFMSPKRSLQDGDLVEVEIEGIGRLSNRVRLLR